MIGAKNAFLVYSYVFIFSFLLVLSLNSIFYPWMLEVFGTIMRWDISWSIDLSLTELVKILLILFWETWAISILFYIVTKKFFSWS